MAELTAEVRALFEGRNMAHVATLMADGAPHVSSTATGTGGV